MGWAIKEVLRKRGLQEDTLMRSLVNAACKVCVANSIGLKSVLPTMCATSKKASKAVCLTFHSPLVEITTSWIRLRFGSQFLMFFSTWLRGPASATTGPSVLTDSSSV